MKTSMGIPARFAGRSAWFLCLLLPLLVAAPARASGVYTTQFGSYGSGSGQFVAPLGVAVDPATHNVYVVDAGNYRVERFNSAGTYLGQFGSQGTTGGTFKAPVAVAIDPTTEDVYVADAGNYVVEKFDSSGTYLSQLGSLGQSSTGPGQFTGPGAVAVDPSSGDVYVADRTSSRVEKFDSHGAYVSEFGSFGTDGNGHLDVPWGLAIDPASGDVYVSDHGQARVERFDSRGKFISQFGSAGTAPGQLSFPWGLAVDPATDDVYVVDEDNARVQLFDSRGRYISRFGSFGSGNGQFVYPTGVAIDPSRGDLYVTDNGYDGGSDAGDYRVEKFRDLPKVKSLTPNAGGTSGANTVTIAGQGFAAGARVYFGAAAATSVTFVSATALKAVAPAHAAGAIKIVVRDGSTASAPGPGSSYAYGPPAVTRVIANAGPPTGGNSVEIFGSGFVPGASVKFGTATSQAVTFISTAELKVVVPPLSGGVVDVRVSTSGGTSTSGTGDLYAYGPPTVSSFAAASGITGSSVTITGTNFVPGTKVKFATRTSPTVTFVSSRSVTAIVPNGALPGPISASTPAGSGTSAASYSPTLSLTSLSPTHGPAGTVVTIRGIGFTRSSIATFNGVAASSVAYMTSTRLLATVPATATSGPVAVTNTTAPVGTVRSAAAYAVGP